MYSLFEMKDFELNQLLGVKGGELGDSGGGGRGICGDAFTIALVIFCQIGFLVFALSDDVDRRSPPTASRSVPDIPIDVG